jgi:hypothetical protein
LLYGCGGTIRKIILISDGGLKRLEALVKMNRKLGILVILYLLLADSKGFSQDYTGIWQGYISGNGPYYNTDYTLNIKTQEGSVVTGRAYIYSEQYLTHSSVLDFIGDINRNTLKITELSIIKSLIAPRIRSECIKFADLKLSRKDNTDYLNGNWNGSTIDKTVCIPGQVYLKRIVPGKPGDISSIPEAIRQEIRQDSSRKISFMETELLKPLIINVSSRFVFMQIKDYMRYDNDTVSIYYNRRLLISKLGIKKQAFIYPVRLERQSGLNEIILYANNLGAVPPNTSELIITDGEREQRVHIETTKQNSAVIYLRYTGKNF